MQLFLSGNFLPIMWNAFNRNMTNRTNNYVESFHRTWNAAVDMYEPLWLGWCQSILILYYKKGGIPANMRLLKVNNRNTSIKSKICSNLTK